jgi:dihydrofolate synthase/folylpolyglutamate synthase
MRARPSERVSFEDAQAHFDSLGTDAMRSRQPSLHRIEALCEALNHPERAVPAIHITGTNGKTSTARIATALLTAAGLSVATFTSPHLVSIRERLALAGEPISEDDFADIFSHMLPYAQLVEERLGEALSYFELLTAMFYLWTAEAPVDAAVVEVGLGGRWDATNVVTAPVAIITNIGLDHTQMLGGEREVIAREKAGIIAPDAVVVAGERAPHVLEVIEAEAARVGATVLAVDRDLVVSENRVAFGGRYLSIRTSVGRYDGLFLPLHGGHQALNAALALEASLRLIPARTLDRDIVVDGFAAVAAPGRLEVIARPDGSTVVLDVAHNPDAMSALVSSLAESFAFDRVLFVIGLLDDKDLRGMLAELARVPSAMVATKAVSTRAVPPDDLRVVAEELGLDCLVVEDVPQAVEAATSAAVEGELVCVTGSHYVVGEARAALVN